MENEDKLTVFNMLSNVGFCDNIHEKVLKSARMRDALYDLPKTKAKIGNLPLPTIEVIEGVSDKSQGKGIKKLLFSQTL